MEKERPLVENRNVGMYPRQWAVVDLHALNFDGNASFALRQIVNEWAQFKAAQMPLPLNDVQLKDYQRPTPTQYPSQEQSAALELKDYQRPTPLNGQEAR